MSKIVYLALPYTGTAKEIAHRIKIMTSYDSLLMEAGVFTVSPCYKHLMFINDNNLPSGWDYWDKYSNALLTNCDSMIVLCIPGWKESIGVQSEIQIAERLNIQIFYVDPTVNNDFYLSVEELEEKKFPINVL